ncbi:MAG: mannitol-1-phosphate 5-dehydrogenase, partial [Lachnospiraceae bacterium]|nr:mannitol-1-phosphate 5-dehydrogenase [Lachnospiraceae bacterium]
MDLLEGKKFPITTLKAIHKFEDFLTRKLYTYNAASCIIAYLGWKKGYTIYSEAANDTEILRMLDENYKLTNEVLCKAYGY